MQTKPRPPAPPLLVLTLGVMAVSTASLLIRLAQAEAPSLVIAAWRMSLAALILLPPAALRRREEIARLTAREMGLALLAGVFLAVHFAAWISSLALTSVASAVVLVDTAPLWVALLAPLALKETLSRPVKIGMLLAVIGAIGVGISDVCVLSEAGLACPAGVDWVRGQAFVGDLLALAGAVAAAVYLVIGRRVRERVSLLSYIFIVYGAAAVVLVGLALVTGGPVFGYSPAVYACFLALAVVPQLLGHTSYNWALGYLPAAYVSIALLGEPLGSTLLAAVFLGEIPSLLKAAGAAATLGGIYLAARG